MFLRCSCHAHLRAKRLLRALTLGGGSGGAFDPPREAVRLSIQRQHKTKPDVQNSVWHANYFVVKDFLKLVVLRYRRCLSMLQIDSYNIALWLFRTPKYLSGIFEFVKSSFDAVYRLHRSEVGLSERNWTMSLKAEMVSHTFWRLQSTPKTIPKSNFRQFSIPICLKSTCADRWNR